MRFLEGVFLAAYFRACGAIVHKKKEEWTVFTC